MKSLLKSKFGKSRSKYYNIITFQDGIRFDSKSECMRYTVLRQQQEMGVISDLKLQESYQIKINGQNLCRYVADFTYTLTDTGEKIVEDVKNPSLSRPSSVFALKKKAMRLAFGIKIKVVHPSKVMVF